MGLQVGLLRSGSHFEIFLEAVKPIVQYPAAAMLNLGHLSNSLFLVHQKAHCNNKRDSAGLY